MEYTISPQSDQLGATANSSRPPAGSTAIIFHLAESSRAGLKLGAKSNLLVLIAALISLAQTILQFMFFHYSKNYIYFVSTVLLGPFQFIAVFLVFSMNFCPKYEKRFKLATWATRMLTLGTIPFVVSVALNILYIIDCNNPELEMNGKAGQDEKLIEEEIKKCFYILYNIAILILNLTCVTLSLVLCVPFNLN